MDLAVLRDQYRSATESQRSRTQVLLFRTVSSELSDAVDVLPVTQGLLSPWEPNSHPSPTATFDPSSVAYDPWHVHLDLHRRHCPSVNMAAPAESPLETATLNNSHGSSSSSPGPRQEVDSASESRSSSTNEEDQDRPRCGPDPGSSDGSVRGPEMVDVVQPLKAKQRQQQEAEHRAPSTEHRFSPGLSGFSGIVSSPVQTMAAQNLESKLKNQLKQEKVQLWNPPYTGASDEPGQQQLQELAERYALLLQLPPEQVGGALESIRIQAVKRGKGNKTFRETSVATLELLLPRDARKDTRRKEHLETRLDVAAQDVADRIRDQYGLKNIKLILNGRTLSLDQNLDQQGVKNHSKVMVLKVSDAEWKQQLNQEEEEKNQNQSQSVQRTQKGFQILSERDGSEDPDTTPFLEIGDQRGNPLKIPPEKKKVLILAMGFHERGRSLMKKKQFDNALCHLLQADHYFRRCGPALLGSVDNFAVLQLDIVWCYQALEALSCLDDCRTRLQTAHDCFLQCYGAERQRLLRIKGNSGREEVLFLRLHLLQSLLLYLEGNDAQARQQLSKVEELYGRLCPDSEKMTQLMTLGFSEREARLGLRACQGDLQEAAIHISSQRQEREEQRRREREKRSRRMENISALVELGFSRRDAARALHLADGDVDRAYAVLQDSTHTNNNPDDVSPEKVQQLLYLGFDRDSSEAALRLTAGDVQSATQLLLDNQGVLSPELLTPPSTSSTTSPSSEEPSTSSSSSTSTSTEDNELVNEVLEDISRHVDDYLDLTLEEESELIATMKSYLSRGSLNAA
ncbi:uncharacterized protein V6R79_024255 [Siganus canaliculatus]